MRHPLRHPFDDGWIWFAFRSGLKISFYTENLNKTTGLCCINKSEVIVKQMQMSETVLSQVKIQGKTKAKTKSSNISVKKGSKIV